MKILFYSSPYKYYQDNLDPVIDFFKKKRSCKVLVARSDKHSEDINDVIGDKESIQAFLSEELDVNAVVLTQVWWYLDKKIAAMCVKRNIPFYIIDHAPPMMLYTEDNGKKSHLYRSNLAGAKAFFAYGNCTKEVMVKRGCRENIIPIGSTRIEKMMSSIKDVEEQNLAIVYDTSGRMEDSKCEKYLNELISELNAISGNWKFMFKEHSRSAKLFKKLYKKDPSLLLSDDNELEYVAKSKLCVFTFPSSAMIIPALLGKKMVALYGRHQCEEAKDYAGRFSDFILNYKRDNLRLYLDYKPNYSKFIKYNLEQSDEPAAKRIANFILKDIK